MKLHKNLIFASALALASGLGLALTGCNDDDEKIPAYFKADNREFTLEYDGLTDKGEEPSLTLNTSGSWKVSQKDEWIHLSRESGTRGSHKIFVTADENTGDPRTGFVEIKLSGSSKTELLAVSQNKKVGTLAVSPALISVTTLGNAAEGETLAFTIDTNSDWTVSLPDGCDWITPSKTSGQAGKEKISFTAALNQTGAEREARITVTAGALSRYTTVRQDCTVFSVSENGKPISKLTFAASNAAGLSSELTVGCIESWTLTAKPQWLTVTPSSGDAGETKVTLTAEVNTEAAREDYITITTAHGLVLTAPVLQLSDRPEPDSKAVGFVYYNDDFSWVKGGADQVSNINGGAPNDARNIYTWDFKTNGFDDVLALFNRKYTDYNASAKVIYAMDGYLKFNKGGAQTAIAIKDALPIEGGHYANVDVTFRAAKNGTDPMTVSVVIEGDGEIVDGVSATQSKELEPFNNSDKTIPWTWTDMKVTVKGATANTRIIIGATPFINNGFKSVATYPDNGKTSYYRWFMDDLKVTRIETK